MWISQKPRWNMSEHPFTKSQGVKHLGVQNRECLTGSKSLRNTHSTFHNSIFGNKSHMMPHEPLSKTTGEAELGRKNRERWEEDLWKGGISQWFQQAKWPTDWQTKNTNKSCFYDVNGWVFRKTLDWISFGHGFSWSHYIFLFYEETQQLRQWPQHSGANPLTSHW